MRKNADQGLRNIAWISKKTKCGEDKMTNKNGVSDDLGDKGSVKLGMSLR